MSHSGGSGWRSADYRQNMARKLEEALAESGRMPFITSEYLENLIYEDASNKDEYLNYAAKWILQLRGMPQAMPSQQNIHLPGITDSTIPQRNISPLGIPEGEPFESLSEVALHHEIPEEDILPRSPQEIPLESILQSAVQHLVPEESIPESSEENIEIRKAVKKKSKSKSQTQKKNNWKSIKFRENMISKLQAAMERSGVTRNLTSADLESHIFRKATTKDEYLDSVAKWILRLAGR